MKKLLLFKFIFFTHFFLNAQTVITEAEIYDFMNNAIFNKKRHTIKREVHTSKYDSAICRIDDTLILRGLDAIIEYFQIKDHALMKYIGLADIEFFKYQIKTNTFIYWDQTKLNSNVRVAKRNRFSPSEYSFPLFSLDRKTVLLGQSSPWGYIAFRKNDITNNWEFIDYLQTGT